MNDSRDFQDAESVRCEQLHGTSVFPHHPDRGLMLSRSLGMPFTNNGLPSIFGHSWYIGKRFFCTSNGVFFSTFFRISWTNPWSSVVSAHTSPYVMSGSQTQFQGQWCQPRPWAINSVISSEGWVSKNYGADQQRLQISDLHFDNFPTPATFACWKVRFKTKVCICSQFLTEAMQWIKEVELFSGWIESSSLLRGISMPRNKRTKKRTNSFAADRLPTWSTNTSGSLGAMILSKTTPTCSLLFFEMTIFRNSILSGTEFSCLLRKSHLMTSWKDCTN